VKKEKGKVLGNFLTYL